MPTNVYGPGASFDSESSHVIPSLIKKFHEAKLANLPEVIIWGSGKNRREFLYVDDLAEAVIWLMNNYDGQDFINVGVGQDISIEELAILIKDIVGYEGKLVFDDSKPGGMAVKLLDVSKLTKLGWQAKTDLRNGLKKTYKSFLSGNLRQ